jgi:hypothetical protein
VDPVPDPLLLKKSGSAGNRTRDLWVTSQMANVLRFYVFTEVTMKEADEGDMLLRNAGSYNSHAASSYHRRQHHSKPEYD